MNSFAADDDMRAPLDGRARARIVWGAVDPGSARIGIAAAEDVNGVLTAAMAPVVVEVGYKIEHDPPIVKRGRDGKEYTLHSTRINGDAEVDAACKIALAHVLWAKVTHLAIEQVKDPYAKGMKQTRNLMVADRIATILRITATREGIVVVMVPAMTWRTRLRKLLQAVTPEEPIGRGDPVRARGIALGHVLRAHIAGWPSTNEGDEHGDGRDAGGIVLWQALPPLEKRVKRAPGERRKQTRKPRAPGEVLPITLANRAKAAAHREAIGCTCGPRKGKHGKDCPAYVRVSYETH